MDRNSLLRKCIPKAMCININLELAKVKHCSIYEDYLHLLQIGLMEVPIYQDKHAWDKSDPIVRTCAVFCNREYKAIMAYLKMVQLWMNRI